MTMAWRGARKGAGVGTAGLGNFGTGVEGGGLCKVDPAGFTRRVRKVALLDCGIATV